MSVHFTNVLAFFAHPDDETMLIGGTLALLSTLGAQVHLLIATRGEGGEMGEPALCSREELGAFREEELRCAAQALGASSLILFDYVDPTVGPDDALFPYTEDEDALTRKVIEEIRKTGADVLISHGVNGEYGHPAHQLTHRAAARAIAELGDRAPLFYTVMGSYPDSPHPRLLNADAPAHLLVDVTPYLPQKTGAALCHRTQHALFVRHRSEEAGRAMTVPEVIWPTESLTRVYPPVDGSPNEIQDALVDFLWKSGLTRWA